MLYIIINHLDAFTETQDIVARDDFLRFVAMNLNEAVEAHGTPDDFIGHTSSNDFLVITAAAAAEPIKIEFSQRLEKSVQTFYDFITRERGHVIYTDRDGKQHKSPMMNLSIGVLSASDGPFPDIRLLAAEARRRAIHAA